MTDADLKATRRLPKDGWAIAVLALLTLAAAWHLGYFDAWLEQLDISNGFLPWYAYLGLRLREGQIPGWLPYQSSGAPFTGDPQSGWMYLPAMLLFPVFAPALAFKLLLGAELLISGLTLYAFARVLRLGALGSLIAAIVFEFHPFANSPTYCCTNRIQIWTWLPLLLLGTEPARSAGRWRERLLPWCLAAFALTQMYAGWLGQGVMYALLVVATFLAYRTLGSGPVARRPLSDRLMIGIATGAAPLLVSVALGAAGLVPRIAVSHETSIGQGAYAHLPGAQMALPSLRSLLLNIAGSDDAPRGIAVGGVALVLLLLAPVLARGKHATSYFAGLTVGSYMLMLPDSPLHHLLDLIPHFAAIHQHNTVNVSAIGAIGPAMLAGAAVDVLPTCVVRSWRRWLLATPLVLLTATLLILGPHGLRDAGLVQIGAVLTTLAVLLAVSSSGRAARAVPVVLVILAVVLPSGAEIVSAQLGHPVPSPWRINQQFEPARMRVLTTSAPGEAADFLQQRLASEGPFRFAGYTPIDPPTGDQVLWSWYIGPRTNRYVQAILTNARAIPLRLSDVSSYNPSQLAATQRSSICSMARPKTTTSPLSIPTP